MLDFQGKTAIIKAIKMKAVRILYTDIFGKTRVKLGLHQHTTRSDGVLSPQEMTALYRENGYDAVAITDHWIYSPVEDFAGIRSLGGAEYHVGNRDAGEGIFHILCLFADREPTLAREGATAQGIIDAIHDAGGLADSDILQGLHLFFPFFTSELAYANREYYSAKIKICQEKKAKKSRFFAKFCSCFFL